MFSTYVHKQSRSGVKLGLDQFSFPLSLSVGDCYFYCVSGGEWGYEESLHD